jgi:putative ABC transport system permease protein
MSFIRNLTGGLRALFRKEQVEQEMDEELRGYLDAAVKEKMRSGMSHADALRAARAEMGSMDAVKEEIRSVGWETTVETLWQDVRYGLRQLGRNRGFTVVAVLTLALGIGANTVMFSVLNGVLLRPLPYKDSGRLMNIISVNRRDRQVMLSVSAADFPFIKGQTDVFDGLALYGYSVSTLTGQGQPEQLAGGAVTPELFPLLGAEPLLGRGLLPDEVTPGKDHVVILGHRLWLRRFGGDRTVIGKIVVLNEELYTVIGVMPAGFAFPAAETELWLPLVLRGQEATSHASKTRRMLARLKRGADVSKAQRELDMVAAHLAEQFPEAQAWGLKLMPLKEGIVGRTRHALLLLLGAVLLVLLIACANVANLFLSRSLARQREIAIRESLGATRRRVVQQLLTESLIIATIGGALGLLFVPWGISFIRAIAPPDVPRLDQASVDGWVLWFAFGASVLTGVLFGLAPAMQVSKPDVNAALKEGFQTAATGFGLFHAQRTRAVLVVSEVALAMVLMSGALLLIKSFWKLVNVDPGFDPHNLLTMELSVTSRKYQDDRAQIVYFNHIIESVAALPAVKSAAVTSGSPINMSMAVRFDVAGRSPTAKEESPLEIAGDQVVGSARRSPTPKEELPFTGFEIVGPDYFRTLGMRFLEGQSFTSRETETSPAVVVISQSFARRYLAGQDPIGRKIHIGWGKGESGTDTEVVGVVSDLSRTDVPWPMMYVSYLQFGANGFMSLLVRTATNPLALADPVRRRIWSVNGEQPVANIRTVEQDISTTVSEPRFHALLLGIFAGLALALALVGIYGVMSYTVIQRTHEIGIRMALGAARTDILRLVLQQGLVFAGFGLAIGLGMSLALTRLLRSFLFEVQPNDPLALMTASVVLAGAALLAGFLPARRATKVDPMVALRYE